MTATVDPCRTFTPDTPSYNNDGRSYAFTFAMPGADKAIDPGDRDELNGIRLEINYSRNSKAYVVAIAVVHVHAHGHTETFGYGRDLDRRTRFNVKTVPAARFSRKTLDSLASEALAGFPASIPPGSVPAEVYARIVAAMAASAS